MRCHVIQHTVRLLRIQSGPAVKEGIWQGSSLSKVSLNVEVKESFVPDRTAELSWPFISITHTIPNEIHSPQPLNSLAVISHFVLFVSFD